MRFIVPALAFWLAGAFPGALACVGVSSWDGLCLAQQPLTGTELLSQSGDIASSMIDGIDQFLREQIDRSVEQRAGRWSRDLLGYNRDTPPTADAAKRYNQSVSSNRNRLAAILGVRDKRVSFSAVEFQKTTAHSGVVGRGLIVEAGENGQQEREFWQASLVRWPVLPGVHAEGILIEPATGRPTVDVVVIPDADQTPEQIAGLEKGVAEHLQYPRMLANQGCRVIIPTLISNRTARRGPTGQPGRAELTNREFVYRPAFELGRHVIGFEVQKVLAAVDWLAYQRPAEAHESGAKDARSELPAIQKPSNRPIAVVGYGEGGLIALACAALDTRIDQTYISGYFGPREQMWQEPISRNLFGFLSEFGDAELASLVFPRFLLIDFTKGPTLNLRTDGGAPGQLQPHTVQHCMRESMRAAELIAVKLTAEISSDTTAQLKGVYLSPESSGWITADSLRANLLPVPMDCLMKGQLGEVQMQTADPLPDSDERQSRQVAELIDYTQKLLEDSPRIRQSLFEEINMSSLESYSEAIEPLRQMFRNEVIGAFDMPLLPPIPRSRLSMEAERWRGYEVALDVFPEVTAYGVLLMPKDLQPGQRRPVVVCQHGLEGRPSDIISGDHPAYHDFASRLCDRGYIVFAPQNIYLFGDRFRTLQRKANSIGKTLFSIMVPQHQQIVDWLQTLPEVDPQRIAFYGLSYGGKSAMRIPALVTDYCLSICSADFNEWIVKNASIRHQFSYVWTGEYEIFEYNLGCTFNYAEMAALICPRPFMVERGHFDAVGEDHWVAFEYAKVRNLYQARLGIGDRTEIEWFVGPHTINGQRTFEFLDKHLRSQPPK